MIFFSKVIDFEVIKRYKKNGLIIIPFFFTFANAVLGLLSVIKALDYEFIAAAYCILLAAFMDSLDGRLARALGLTSVLGMELDSLCDAISFCLAPVVLLYCCQAQDFGTVGFIVLAIYLCSGLFRLAKFNITTENQSNNFLGLPTPIAAFFLTCLVLYQDWIESVTILNFLFHKNIFACLVIFISYLMISKIKFPSFKYNRFNKGILFYIFLIFMILLLFITRHYPFMIFFPIIYILNGCIKNYYSKVKMLYNRKKLNNGSSV